MVIHRWAKKGRSGGEIRFSSANSASRARTATGVDVVPADLLQRLALLGGVVLRLLQGSPSHVTLTGDGSCGVDRAFSLFSLSNLSEKESFFLSYFRQRSASSGMLAGFFLAADGFVNTVGWLCLWQRSVFSTTLAGFVSSVFAVSYGVCGWLISGLLVGFCCSICYGLVLGCLLIESVGVSSNWPCSIDELAGAFIGFQHGLKIR